MLCVVASQENETNRPLLRPNNYATTSRRTVTTDINGHTILNSGDATRAQHDSCWVMLLHCLQGDANYRIFKASSKSGTLSVSKIDSLARIIFPFSFTCLNVLYWAGFLYYFWLESLVAKICFAKEMGLRWPAWCCSCHWNQSKVIRANGFSQGICGEFQCTGKVANDKTKRVEFERSFIHKAGGL